MQKNTAAISWKYNRKQKLNHRKSINEIMKIKCDIWFNRINLPIKRWFYCIIWIFGARNHP